MHRRIAPEWTSLSLCLYFSLKVTRRPVERFPSLTAVSEGLSEHHWLLFLCLRGASAEGMAHQRHDTERQGRSCGLDSLFISPFGAAAAGFPRASGNVVRVYLDRKLIGALKVCRISGDSPRLTPIRNDPKLTVFDRPLIVSVLFNSPPPTHELTDLDVQFSRAGPRRGQLIDNVT